MKKDITELYCCVEDFCRTVDDNFANMLLSKGRKPTNPNYGLNKEIKVQLRRGKQVKLEYFNNNLRGYP